MSKLNLQKQALKLRLRGGSIRDIAMKLEVSKSSVSLWCRKIKLTELQIKRMTKAKSKAIRRGKLMVD